MAKVNHCAKNVTSIPTRMNQVNPPKPIVPRAALIVRRAMRRATPTRPPACAKELITTKTHRANANLAHPVVIVPNTTA